MTRMLKPPARLLAAGCVAMVTAACVTPSGAQHRAQDTDSGLRCAIVTRDLGGTVELTGRIAAQTDTDGSYTLSIRNVSASGSAVINQAGDFSVRAGRSAVLSQVVLGGAAHHYQAELELVVDGQRLRCRAADDQAET